MVHILIHIDCIDVEVNELLEWISTIDPQTRHRDISRKRRENTGDWFLRTEQFLKWRDYSQGSDESFENTILGVYGIPGAGKSVILYAKPIANIVRALAYLTTNHSSFIVDHIQTAFESENEYCITWL